MQSYTLSFYAKGSGAISSYLYPTAVMGWIKPDGSLALDNTSNNSSTDGYTLINLTTEWTKYIITWTAFCSGGTRKNLIIARLSPNTDAYIAGIKIERGGRATAY
nr:MAG TPA: putative glycosyl hydrolase family protein [Caudoviricetes sp.]